MLSNAVLRMGESSEEVTIAPRRWPGMQYDLEKENKWMKVERQFQELGRAGEGSGEMHEREGFEKR